MLFEQDIHIPEALTGEAVSVSLVEEKLRFNIRVKPADVTTFKKLSGLQLPTKINNSSSRKELICFKIGPDEWIVIAPPEKRQALKTAFAKISNTLICSVTDISHRNIAFQLSGPRAAGLLNVGCPLDLSLTAFPIGKVTRSVFESAQVMIFRNGKEEFHVECWRSFGPYLRDFFNRVVTTR